MLTIARLDTAIKYLVLAFAAVMGFSRGGIHTGFWLLLLVTVIRYCWQPFPLTVDRDLRRAMLIFFGALALSTAFSGDPATSLKFFGLSAVKVLPVFIVMAVVKEREITERATMLMAGSVLIGAGIAYWQVLHGATRGTVKSTLGIMDFGGIIGLLVPLLLVKGLEDNVGKKARLLYFASAAAALVALAFNGTRAVWVAVLVTMVLYVLINLILNWRKGWRAAIIACAMLLVVTVIFADNQYVNYRLHTITDTDFASNHRRLEMWHYAVEVFKDHPMLGVGLGTMPGLLFSPAKVYVTQQAYGHVHNNFLQMLAENGLVGGLAYIFLFAVILINAVRLMRRVETRSWAIIAFLCTVDFLIHGMFDYTLLIPTIAYSYWFILGLAYVNFLNKNEPSLVHPSVASVSYQER